MMLYVFHVDVGVVLTFDMTVAISSVANLKSTIDRLHGIPAENIVLLASGGEMLTNNSQVSYYSAGTDTNPIYMFVRGEFKLSPPLAPMEADSELKEQVERSLELPAIYDTVVKRAQIAAQMNALAQEELTNCTALVHDQHLQQQGWSAVVANMEDLTAEFCKRFRGFCTFFDKHLQLRPSYVELLNNFSNDLSKLSRIPILPGLMQMAEADFHGFDDFLENDDVFSRSTNPQQSVLTAGANTATSKETSGHDGLEIAGGNNTGADNIDDKSSSSISTSPNKKLKMANDSNEERISHTSETSIGTSSRLNLLQWITSKENHNILKTMSEECIQGLSKFNEEIYGQLKEEFENTVKSAQQSDVKEIRGLGERLCQLEELKYKIRNMVRDQAELSTAFQQNQNRAIILRDASILPDLCASHQSQLLVMLQNHKKIREVRHCIVKAKYELGANVHARLKRIMFIENAMSEFDNRLLFYHGCLRRAERHICIIEQIHQAPNMYVAAVTEVMRRKIFSKEFRLWASKLAADFESIQIEEMKRRQQFNSSFEGHFLNILFPGMGDMPPNFSNEDPLVFDARLPNITRSDIDVLTTYLPEMASQMQLPDMEPVIYFFVSHSGAHQRERLEELRKQKEMRIAEELKPVTGDDTQSLSSSTAMVVSAKLPLNPRLSELRKDGSGSATGGDESETDTETEFEQVPANNQQSVATSTSENLQQILAVSKCTATDELVTQCCAETLTDENYETLKNEVTHMRVMLGAMSKLALECMDLARSNLRTFRDDYVTQKEDMQSDLQALNEKWEVLRMQCEAREREIALEQNNNSQYILQLRTELRRCLSELKSQKQLNEKLISMKSKCDSLESQVMELKFKLKSADVKKEESVAKACDALIQKHKTEMESLRQRFKLMTSMERSPSDLSLETSPINDNFIEKHIHESMLSQLRSELEAEKEKAITAAIEMERSIWQSKIFPSSSQSVLLNAGILKEMLEEKTRQLEQLREKDLMLTKENYQLKTRLDALTNEEGNSWLKEKIEYLNRDKCRLEEELNNEKSKRLEMETSIAALKCSTYEQSPMSRSKSSGSSHKVIVLDSCSKGDLVLAVWSMRYSQFMIVQDSPSLYFLHGDSLSAMNLLIPQATEEAMIPIPFYVIGRVVEKEYCQARKSENRYHVQRGTKFYRIKLTPLACRMTARRERLESFSSCVGRSISQCESQSTYCSTSPSLSGIATTSPDLGVSSQSKDVADGATENPILLALPWIINTAANQAAAAAAAPQPLATLSLIERTISISSVTEEDDEPSSLLTDRCRYISVSEEDESLLAASAPAVGVTGDEAAAKQNIMLQNTTVITEQPTASTRKLEFECMQSSADLQTTATTVNPTPTAVANITQEDGKFLDNIQNTPTTVSSIDDTLQNVVPFSSITICTDTTQTSAAILVPSEQELTGLNSPLIPTSVGTTSEDSDEYRSLEPKDDTDFPISE